MENENNVNTNITPTEPIDNSVVQTPVEPVQPVQPVEPVQPAEPVQVPVEPVQTPSTPISEPVSPIIEPVQTSAIDANGVTPDPQPMVGETPTVQMGSEPTPVSSPKKGFPVIIIVIALVALLLVGGVVAFFLLFSNPTKVYTKEVDGIYKKLSDANKEFGSKSNAVGFSDGIVRSSISDLVIDTNYVTEEDLGFDLKSATAEIITERDGKTNEMYTSMKVTQDDAVIDINAHMEKEVMLITSKMFKETIKVDIGDELDSELLNTKYSEKDVETILVSVKNALNSSIKKDYITKTKGSILVNGQNIDANKYTLTIDKKNKKEIYTSIANALKGDSKFVSAVKNLTGTEEKEVIEGLEEFAKGEDDVTYTVDIYTKGFLNKFIGTVITSNDTYGKNSLTYTTSDDLDVYEIEEGSDKTVFEVGKSKDTIKNIVIKKGSSEIVTIKFDTFNDTKVEGTFDVNVANLEKESNTEYDSDKINGSFEITSKISNKNVDGDFAVQVNIDDKYVKVTGKVKSESISQVTKIDGTNAVAEEEAGDLYTEIETYLNSKNSGLAKLIYSFLHSDYDSDYDYDYDYDYDTDYDL